MDDIQAGARVAEFYAGQIVDVVKLFEDADYLPADPLPQHGYLAASLDSLRPEVDNGRLAVGYIWERFDRMTPPLYKVRNSRALGALLRSIPLTISSERHRANGRVSAYCLIWDTKVENFLLDNVLDVQQCSHPYTGQGFTALHVEVQKTPMFSEPAEGENIAAHGGFLGGQCSRPRTSSGSGSTDDAALREHRERPSKDKKEIAAELPKIRRVVGEDGQVREVCEI